MPEPRLRLLEDSELPDDARALIAPGQQQDILRTFNHHPELFAQWNGFYKHVMRDGAVSMRVKELMRLRIARLNECAV